MTNAFILTLLFDLFVIGLLLAVGPGGDDDDDAAFS